METEIIGNQNMGTRAYNFVISFLEVVILLVRMVLEMFVSAVKLVLPDDLADVSGEIVLITGTGHGIGKEMALQYTRLGCTVVCVDINEAGNRETVKEANEQMCGTAHHYVCDVSNRENVLELAKRVRTEIGPVSILVNNVGIMPTHAIDKHTPVEIKKIFDINVLSQFWTIEGFLPHMKEKNRGHIVAISSIAGVVGLANLVPYCATKFAVRGMMEALLDELREEKLDNLINLTTIYPYMVNTGLCKRPKVRFPTLLGLLEPKITAESIIKAQRLKIKEATVPRSLLYINNFCRLLPFNCAMLMKDFIGSGVESDL